MSAIARIEVRELSKHFGGVQALDSASITIARGSVHALVGENGAGKSTLGKIVAGLLAPDSGQLLFDGEPLAPRSPRDALDRGIAAIGQEPSVVPRLTVAENVFLGAEPRRAGFIRRRALRKHYQRLVDSVGFAVSGDALAGGLRTAEQQEVEILRALSRSAEVIVMDEPTAALSGRETARFHETVRSLAGAGKTILLISHFLKEVLELADTVTVLRDGRVIRTAPTVHESEASLIEAMLGRTLSATFPPKHPPRPDAPVVLSVAGLNAPGVANVDIEVRAGEIVGLAGLVGAGRSELALAVYGANPVRGGQVKLNGSVLRGGPRQRLSAGVALIPESRKNDGLILSRSVVENASLASVRKMSRLGIVQRRREKAATQQMLVRCDVRAARYSMPVRALSGGNQQKVLLARMLLCRPALVIADEPTRGVDVGAKRSIYEFLVVLADEGLAILLISSELEEIIGLAHRVAVIRNGRIVAELSGDQIDEPAILAAAFGEHLPIEGAD